MPTIAKQANPIPSSSFNVASVTISPPGPSTTTTVAAPATYLLLSLQAVNRNAAARYVQVFKGATATGTPLVSFFIPAAGSVLIGDTIFTLGGLDVSSTFTVAFSTANTPYTAATATDHDLVLMYRE